MNEQAKPTLRTVTIDGSGVNERIVSVHRAADKEEAINKAIKKAYGKNAKLFGDHGLNEGDWKTSRLPSAYGQIVVPAKSGNGVMNCITGRVLVKVEDTHAKKRTAEKQTGAAQVDLSKQWERHASHPTPAPKSRGRER